MRKHLSRSREHGDTVKQTETGELKDSWYFLRSPQVRANHHALFPLAGPGGKFFTVPLSELEFTSGECGDQAQSPRGRVRKLSGRVRVGLPDGVLQFPSSNRLRLSVLLCGAGAMACSCPVDTARKTEGTHHCKHYVSALFETCSLNSTITIYLGPHHH